METILLQSVAATAVGRGYLSSDHLSTATGLDPAITISKNGGNFANPAAGASVMTEIEATGWYKFALGTGDTDTLGPLIIRGTHATMDNIEVVYQVVAANTAAAVTSIANDAITAASINTGALTADAFAADAIVAATLATGVLTADAFAADAIIAATLATGALTADAFAANAITSTVIADDAITAAKLNTGAISADAFAADAIVAATLATGVLTADAFAADAIVAATLATDAISADALAADAVGEIWTTALTESYAADAAAPTPAQALFMLLSFLFEREVVTTTVTCKKLDGSTTAMTFTLNDADEPTSITKSG